MLLTTAVACSGFVHVGPMGRRDIGRLLYSQLPAAKALQKQGRVVSRLQLPAYKAEYRLINLIISPHRQNYYCYRRHKTAWSVCLFVSVYWAQG